MQSIHSAKRYQLVMDQAIEHAVIIMDATGRILEWSGGAEKLFGWSAPEAVGQPAALIFTTEDNAIGAAAAELGTANVLGRSSDVRWHARKDGTTVFCDGIVTKVVADDGVTHLGFGKVVREAYSTVRDDSGTPSTASSEQRSFLSAVLESVENGIVACDQHGRLTFFNEAAQLIHGQGTTPLAAARWAETYQLYREDGVTLLPAAEVPLHRALMGERVEDAAIVVRAANGSQRNLLVSGRAMRDGAGTILGAVISMNDVTSVHDTRRALDVAALERSQRKVAEASGERLRRAEEQLRVATEAAQLGIWTWDVRAERGTWENERMYAIFGVPRGSAVPGKLQQMASLFHPDDVVRFRDALDATMSTGAWFQFAARVRNSRPDDRWVEMSGALESLDSTVVIGTAADITERMKIEHMLEEARVRQNATLVAGDVATWLWAIGPDRISGDANLGKMFGRPGAPIEGATLESYLALIDPADRADVARSVAHSVATKSPYDATYRIANASGALRWISARGRIEDDAHGQPEFLAGVLLDITVQKDAQDALRIAEERYRVLITSMDQAFAIVQVLLDAEGTPVDYRFEEVNRAFEEQSGLVDAAGKTIKEMVPNIESRWIEAYGRVALTREPARFAAHSEAMGRWWDVFATPTGEAADCRIAILFADITARRQAEEKLRQLAADLSESNQRKTEFLATLAHELRNPLAPMRTGLDLLRMKAARLPQGDKVLDMMERQLKQMVHLIDDLMDVSRINSGKIMLKTARIDVNDAITHAAESAMPAMRAAGHRFGVDVSQPPVFIEGDPTRLAQILGNLLTNAAKYTPNGGTIAISARRAGDSVVIDVTDTGLGISAEEQLHVFDMFNQVSRNMGRAQGGLGIGLSLVRSLVRMHGGEIAVRSAGAGRGSTFTVTLPAAPDAAAAAALPAVTADAARSLRVVIADDNVDSALMLAALLDIAGGHHSDVVHDGVRAVEEIAARRPHLAIVDIGMPGLNGYEVAKRVRARPELAGVLLVALTGWGGELDRARSQEAGFDAHLTKPAGIAELAVLLDRAAGNDVTQPRPAGTDAGADGA